MAASVGSPFAEYPEEFFVRVQLLQRVPSSSIKLPAEECALTVPFGEVMFATVILFCVRVPVLSEHITPALPSVSTAGRCLIIARCIAIFLTPNASTIVTTAGSPSGIAATARLIDIMNISSGGTF